LSPIKTKAPESNCIFQCTQKLTHILQLLINGFLRWQRPQFSKSFISFPTWPFLYFSSITNNNTHSAIAVTYSYNSLSCSHNILKRCLLPTDFFFPSSCTMHHSIIKLYPAALSIAVFIPTVYDTQTLWPTFSLPPRFFLPT
jgi:hypothetical protein